MRNKAAFLSVFLVSFLIFSCCAEAEEKKQNDAYETIARSIKDDPRKVIDDLKAVADTDDAAAMQYLIMLGHYQPEKINTREFQDTAYRLHTKITAYYEKRVQNEPDGYDPAFERYQSMTKDGYLYCYQNLKCLIQVGVFNFSKLSGEYGKKAGEIVIPCPAAQKTHLTLFPMRERAGLFQLRAISAIRLSARCRRVPEVYSKRAVL